MNKSKKSNLIEQVYGGPHMPHELERLFDPDYKDPDQMTEEEIEELAQQTLDLVLNREKRQKTTTDGVSTTPAAYGVGSQSAYAAQHMDQIMTDNSLLARYKSGPRASAEESQIMSMGPTIKLDDIDLMFDQARIAPNTSVQYVVPFRTKGTDSYGFLVQGSMRTTPCLGLEGPRELAKKLYQRMSQNGFRDDISYKIVGDREAARSMLGLGRFGNCVPLAEPQRLLLHTQMRDVHERAYLEQNK